MFQRFQRFFKDFKDFFNHFKDFLDYSKMADNCCKGLRLSRLAGLLFIWQTLTPPLHLQIHSQEAPRMDGPSRPDRHRLPSHRTRVCQHPANNGRSRNHGQSRDNSLVVDDCSNHLHKRRPQWLPPATDVQDVAAPWLSPLQVHWMLRHLRNLRLPARHAEHLRQNRLPINCSQSPNIKVIIDQLNQLMAI